MTNSGRKILVLTMSIFCLSSCSKPFSKHLDSASSAKSDTEAFAEVNSDDPGKEIDKYRSIVYGKYTVLEFGSAFCPGCVQLKGHLHTLVSMRPDIVVRSFDINRPGVQGIDWDSPLAKQLKVHSIPYLEIINDKGSLVAKGRDAEEQVIQELNDELRAKH